MENKIIAKSIRSKSNFITVLFGVGFFIFLILLLENNSVLKNDYEKNIRTIGLIIIVLIILYCIYYLLNHKRIYVYKNYFEIKELLRKRKIYFSKIKKYSSEYIEGEDFTWTEHYIILDTEEKITLKDFDYSNFDYFFSFIEKRFKKYIKTN
ncbi:hypothetical protein G6N05_03280 [Flavobacterium sp. F372]|uniref:YcxB family protein n=1 Tax=Flavobacterium bernardetii TaxID=2813823 RepID=A0ABR7IVS5_9FLAO|nr:hypothetical protein [Flavobacterium bernardetii]MBC5833895.1 hypothetical protein [Flavobacterium bernardetii]NHF69128.1 hypothetical protein [Flavobacterium bernardetii]